MLQRLELRRPESDANPDGDRREAKDKREGAPHSTMLARHFVS
jgi:hypothetical protein